MNLVEHRGLEDREAAETCYRLTWTQDEEEEEDEKLRDEKMELARPRVRVESMRAVDLAPEDG